MNSLTTMVQGGLGRDPHGADMFVFRGKVRHRVKVLWYDWLGCLPFIPTRSKNPSS